MKKYIYLISITLLLLNSCVKDGKKGSYSFLVKNFTSETITLKFVNNSDEVILLPTEEKEARIILTGFGVYPYDIIKTDFESVFSDLIFNTYINGEKLDKGLWLPENWTYYSKSKWEAEYKMTITNEMLKE